jgi:hypothetical protein
VAASPIGHQPARSLGEARDCLHHPGSLELGWSRRSSGVGLAWEGRGRNAPHDRRRPNLAGPIPHGGWAISDREWVVLLWDPEAQSSGDVSINRCRHHVDGAVVHSLTDQPSWRLPRVGHLTRPAMGMSQQALGRSPPRAIPRRPSIAAGPLTEDGIVDQEFKRRRRSNFP